MAIVLDDQHSYLMVNYISCWTIQKKSRENREKEREKNR